MTELQPTGSAAAVAHPHAAVEQLDALTSLRFFAAIYVLLFHYVIDLSAGRLQSALTHLGYTGVTFFFVLSGFILAHNYHRVDFNQRDNRERFFAARLSRIYPVFLLSLLVSVPFALAQFLKMPAGLLKGFAAAGGLLAPLGLQSWVPGASCAINCPNWSISTELFFYLLFPFLVLPLTRNPGRWFVVTLAVWASIAAVATSAWDQFGSGSIMADHAQTLPVLLAQAIKYFPAGRLPEFMLGIVLYGVWRRTRHRIDGDWALLAFIVAATAIVAVSSRIPETLLHNGLTAVAWAPLILAAASMRDGLLCSTWAVFLGRISFSLYLFHIPVLNLLKALDKRLFASHLAHEPVAAIVLATALAIVVAAIVHRFVEEPSRRPVAAWLLARWRPTAAVSHAA